MDIFYKEWPNVKSNQGDSDYDSFWEHEWSKHGTCSGFSQADYFQKALDAYPQTPDIISSNVGKSVSKTDLIKAHNHVVAPQCQGSYLSQILSCVSKDLKAMDCPDSVVEEG